MSFKNIFQLILIITFILSWIKGVYAIEKSQNINTTIVNSNLINDISEQRKEAIKEKIRQILKKRRKQDIVNKIIEIRKAREEKKNQIIKYAFFQNHK